jgi:hypothetical protein
MDGGITLNAVRATTNATARIAALGLVLLLAAGCGQASDQTPSPGESPGISPQATVPSQSATPPESATPPGSSIPPEATIALVVDAGIYPGIAASVAQFEADLAGEAYAAVVKESSMRTPEEVRAYLKDTYETASPPLEGAILIGDLPRPRYRLFVPARAGCNVADRGPEEYVSMQFYQDLDGVYSRSDPGSCDHAGCYDGHTGDVGSEIWVSVLPFLTDDATTIDSVNRYFARNHAYRTGADRPKLGFFLAGIGASIDTPQKYDDQVAFSTSSSYAWTPIASRGNVGVFLDNSLGDPARYPQASDGFEGALLSGDYDFAEISAHGSPTVLGAQGGSIKINAGWVSSHHIRATFVWDMSCSNGDLDVDGNLLTAFVYSDSDVLLAAGATGDSGGLGTNVNGFFRPNIGQALAAGETVGEAYLDHINAPFEGCNLYQREYFTAPTVFIGDLTLRLQEHMG